MFPTASTRTARSICSRADARGERCNRLVEHARPAAALPRLVRGRGGLWPLRGVGGRQRVHRRPRRGAGGAVGPGGGGGGHNGPPGPSRGGGKRAFPGGPVEGEKETPGFGPG